MTTAHPADQRRLLDLQALDTRIAQLRHERRTLPALAALEELDGRAADLHRAQIGAKTEISDLEREVEKAEADVDQVRTRLQRTQKRYDAGEGLSRELVAMQQELESLERRKQVLEEEELEIMEQLDAAQKRSADIAVQEEAVRADQAIHEQQRDDEFARIDAEMNEATTARDDLARVLNENAEEMMYLYERARERSGGLGAVAMYGRTAEGMSLNLTLAEYNALETAAPEEVVLSDEAGYILVRMDQGTGGRQ